MYLLVEGGYEWGVVWSVNDIRDRWIQGLRIIR
jgi:hypothetical protein